MSARDVVLVDAGGTNIGSLRYALQRLGIDAQVSDDGERIRRATHVILPGVGAAGPGMARLRQAGLVELMRSLEQPVLGVCLGMQLLFEHSQEGDTPCLGVIPGCVVRIPATAGRRVPHMGWNALQRLREDALFDGLAAPDFVYFVHGYAAPVGASTVASVEHGACWSAIVRQRNFCGMQFHPERSSATGAALLRNFLGS
ncbi:MAG: imidazole glycerol phosphate synthase, glutamine amidotransferase subunit [Lysobacterales bacterium 63-13]|nr:MAG: imidazole glycerol phosphate synthase, glutamine amidotransferase subunit [Xanthomonadales bacterium 63-13]